MAAVQRAYANIFHYLLLNIDNNLVIFFVCYKFHPNSDDTEFNKIYEVTMSL